MITKQKLIEQFPYDIVAVISPHPDDSCIAAGGLLYRLSQELPGVQTHVLVMTSGYRGVTDRYLQEVVTDEASAVPECAAQRTRITGLLSRKRTERLPHDEREFLRTCRAAIRRREVECEAATLGFTPHFLGLEIYDEHTVTERDEATLSAKLSELRVAGPRRLLIMPGRYEQHQTHRLAADLVSQVVEDHHRAQFELWAYDSPWSAMMPRPDVVVPLTEEALRAKLEATHCHRSQLERTPYAGIVEGTAVRTAAVLSEWLGAFDVCRSLDLGPYAEVFERLTDSVVYE